MATLKGITLEIGGNTTQLQQSLKQVDQEAKRSENALKEIDKALKFNPKSTELLAMRQEELGNQISATSERLEMLKEADKTAKDQLNRGEISTAEYAKLQGEIGRTEQTLEKLKHEADESKQKLAELGESAKKHGASMQDAGKKLTVGLTAPILAIGAAATAAWSEYDDAIDGIILATGASGDALEDMEDVYRSVFGSLPVESEKVSSAIGELNTQFAFTGEELENATSLMVRYGEITGQDVVAATQGAKGIIEAYGLEYSDLGKVLDDVAKAAQDTGADTGMLMSQMQKTAPQIKALGLDTGEAAQLMGQLGQHGLDASNVLGGLTRAQVEGAKSGKDLNAVLGGFTDLVKSGASETEILNEASRLFGTRRGPAMVQAARQGVLDFDALADAAAGAGGTVANTFEDTLDPIDNAKVAMNNFKLASADLGTAIQIGAAPALDWLAEKSKGVVDAFRALDTEQQQFIVTLGAGLAAVGPATAGIGKLTEGVGKMMERAAGAADGTGKLSAALGGGGKLALAGVAIAVVAALVQYHEQLRAVDAETQALLDSSREARDAFEGQMTAIDDNAAVSGDLIVRLRELEGQTELTADEQAEMHGIMSALNDLYPDLNLQIDEETGLLNLNADAIEKATRAQEDKLRLQAVDDEYLRLLQEEKDIKDQLAQAEMDVQELIEKGFFIRDEETGRIEQAKHGFSGQWDSMRSVVDGYNLLRDAQDENTKNLEENTEQRTGLIEEQTKATEAALKAEEEAAEGVKRIWQRRVTDQELALEDLTEQEREYIKRMQEHGEERNDFLKGQLDVRSNMAEEEYKALDTAWQKEEEARFNRDAKRKSDLETWQEFEEEALRQTIANQEQYARDLDSELNNQLGILSAFADDEFKSLEASADQHYEHNKKKMEAYTSYNKNLSELRGRVSDEMYEELVKMGPEHSSLIAEYADMTEEELAKHSNQWTEIYKVTGQVAEEHLETIPEITADVLAEQEGILRDSSGKLYDAETETMDFVRQAIEDKRPDIKEEMEETSEAMQKAAKTDLRGLGQEAVETYEQGMQDWRPMAEREAEELAYQVFMSADGSLEERGQKAVETYVQAMADAEQDAIDQALQLAREVEKAAETKLFDQGSEGIHGYVDGQESKRAELERKTQEMADEVEDIMTVDLNSEGVHGAETYIDGIKKVRPAVLSTAESLAINARNKTKTTYINEGEHGATTYASGIRNRTPGAEQASRDMAQKAKTSARTSFSSEGSNAASSFADGIKSQRWRVQNEATSLGNVAKNSLKSTMQIASPSRVTRGYGRNTGEGFVLGMQDMVREVEHAAEDLTAPLLAMDGKSVDLGINANRMMLPDLQQTVQTRVVGGLEGIVNSQEIAGAIVQAMRGMGLYVNDRQLGEVTATGYQVATYARGG